MPAMLNYCNASGLNIFIGKVFPARTKSYFVSVAQAKSKAIRVQYFRLILGNPFPCPDIVLMSDLGIPSAKFK